MFSCYLFFSFSFKRAGNVCCRTLDLNVESKAAQIVKQDVKGRRRIQLGDRQAFDDGVVGGRTSENVVGLDGQNFLQGMRRAVAEQSPDFHFAEALAAVLGLAAERLLSDERVRADRAHMDFILD